MPDSPPRILLVDDDGAMLEAFTQTVRYRLPTVGVDSCSTGQAALEHLRATEYHAIISDLTMPDLSGLALLEEAKKTRPCVPVLFMTGRTEAELLTEAAQHGAYDFIHKPVDRDQMVLSIKRALEAYELRLSFDSHQVVAGRLSQEIRQLQQVLKPLLLSSLKALGRELGDERIEQSRSMIETAVSLCRLQTRIVRRNLDFADQVLGQARRQLDAAGS